MSKGFHRLGIVLAVIWIGIGVLFTFLDVRAQMIPANFFDDPPAPHHMQHDILTFIFVFLLGGLLLYLCSRAIGWVLSGFAG